MARNVTERKHLENELLEASQTDPLTHAANWRRLIEVLQSHFAAFRRYHHPMALIMFDLDHFKPLSDHWSLRNQSSLM
ncbi:GGDEF domain-containing protein [Marinobacterium halophilum]|uniref:GGDEF domain-containing protein n=1 Tax=Marinobacterium halophilum TaxID=267374 RepID=UPI001473A079|nr:GGDEF domain-containing protein [Marinobacterium halophilum]